MLLKKGHYHRKVIILILIFLLLRLITAATVELGNDESYYWLYSRDLQWNYFDHPPMVGVWVRLFTLDGWLDEYEVFVRAGSLLGCAFSTWFLYRAVTLIQDERAGWFAACLFNASLYAGMIAGVLNMPDSPQLFFWTFCLLQIAKLINNDRRWLTWLLLGLSAGLCVMSKIHGVFIWIGLALFILFKKREWLRYPQLYAAILVSMLITSPILFWNLRHDFMTWRFHSARVDITAAAVEEKDGFWIELLQQVVINNPVNMLLIIAAIVFFTRNKSTHPALTAYNFIALPLAIALVVISMFRDIWFHWSGPAYTTLLPLAAVYLAITQPGKIFPASLKWSTAVFTLVLMSWPVVIHYYPGTYGTKQNQAIGQGDVTLDRYGWKQSGESFARMYQDEVANGMSPATPVICPTWWGSHVEYYFGRPANATVIGLGTVQSLHHYAWLNAKRLPGVDMDTAYCIVSSIEDTTTATSISHFYRQKELAATIPVYRGGKPASNFYVYKLTGWKEEEEVMAIR
jgi:4-amino-4-deoxy-L-arabinose transferase-like glycosyltransferase